MLKRLLLLAVMILVTVSAFAEIKYISGYYTDGGQYRSGHYRDTSNDGVRENNANYLGYNGHKRPEGIY